jgi:hypothetical protein
VKLAVPFTVGDPEITPPLESVSPVGRLPAVTDHVYPGVPPEAVRDALYGVPFVPEDKAVVVIASVEGVEIVIDSVAIAFTAGDSLSATWMVNVAVPPAVGFPEITPVFDNVRPAGKLPAAMVHVYPGVPPVAAIAALYAVPVWPAAKTPVVMLSVDGAVIVSDSVAVAVCAGDSSSDTATVKLEAPLPVGVPEIRPALESASPAGRWPEESFHTYPGVPPFAFSVLL